MGKLSTAFESENSVMIKAPIRNLAVAGGIALAALALQPQAVLAQEEAEANETQEITKGEKQLAKLLEGRVAGEPVNCIRDIRNQRLTVIDKTAYVYGRGKTIYVQRTRNPESIDDFEILVTQRFGSQICRTDQVTTVDPVGAFITGPVFFDYFVPYTKVEENEG